MVICQNPYDDVLFIFEFKHPLVCDNDYITLVFLPLNHFSDLCYVFLLLKSLTNLCY